MGMKRNVLIIGAGGVAHVAVHKAAMYNHILGDICIASRTVEKCQQIIDSIHRKGSLRDTQQQLYARQLDASCVDNIIQLIQDTQSQIVINVASAFVNMNVLEACIATGTTYLDTAIHEQPDRVCENPPWYANYEWQRKDRCAANKVAAILGAGFDPGVVNAYCALAAQQHFDQIDSIDILDVNAGSHGRYFATNFDPEINFREFSKVWTWVNREWREYPTHSIKRDFDFPEVGISSVYLTGHDEVHSLSQHLDVPNIRFWMGFGDHYINVFSVLRNLGLLSHEPVNMPNGQQVVPLQVVKALLPDPKSLAPDYQGKTWIGVLFKGQKDGQAKAHVIYQVSDHAACYQEVEAQAISYTAGVPVVAAAILAAQGVWNPETMVNIEQLDPVPFIALLDEMGLPTTQQALSVAEAALFNGEIADLAVELKHAVGMVQVSAANPMLSTQKPTRYVRTENAWPVFTHCTG